MPILESRNLVFIHIPKSGGSSVEQRLRELGPLKGLEPGPKREHPAWKRFKHSPQHCTYRELEQLGALRNKAREPRRVFAVIRHPFERVVSEYNFWKHYFPAHKKLGWPAFLARFLTTKDTFDNHNLPNLDFIVDSRGAIPPETIVIPYSDEALLQSIAERVFPEDKPAFEQFAGKDTNVRAHKTEKRFTVAQLSRADKQRIARHFRKDEVLFPDLSEYL